MGGELWWILGFGAVTLGGIFLYAYSKDSNDPVGYLTDFMNFGGLDDLFSGSFLDKKWNPEIPKGTTLDPKTGESQLIWGGK